MFIGRAGFSVPKVGKKKEKENQVENVANLLESLLTSAPPQFIMAALRAGGGRKPKKLGSILSANRQKGKWLVGRYLIVS